MRSSGSRSYGFADIASSARAATQALHKSLGPKRSGPPVENYQGQGGPLGRRDDSVQPPTEPTIVAVIERCLCRVTIGEDCYVVTGVGGGVRSVRYGAPLRDWERVCRELLDEAMKDGMV